MRFVVGLLFVFFIIMATVASVGIILPEQYLAQRSVELKQPPEELWNTLSDIESFPSWRSDLENVSRIEDQYGNPVWQELDKRGQKVNIEVGASQPENARILWHISAPEYKFYRDWLIEIQATADGNTVLTISERGKVYNIIQRFFAHFFTGYTNVVDAYLMAIAQKFDETPAITDRLQKEDPFLSVKELLDIRQEKVRAASGRA